MTWAIVINPTSGQGKGAEVGRAAVGYFGKHDLKYQIITGISAENVSRDLRSFLHANQECEGVLCVVTIFNKFSKLSRGHLSALTKSLPVPAGSTAKGMRSGTTA